MFDGVMFDGVMFDGVMFDGVMFDGVMGTASWERRHGNGVMGTASWEELMATAHTAVPIPHSASRFLP
jgi:hypothetical protein